MIHLINYINSDSFRIRAIHSLRRSYNNLKEFNCKIIYIQNYYRLSIILKRIKILTLEIHPKNNIRKLINIPIKVSYPDNALANIKK